jgi:hypothetical protein
MASLSKYGGHILQKCEGLIWPSRHVGVKYAVEAAVQLPVLILIFSCYFLPCPKFGSALSWPAATIPRGSFGLI